MPLSIWRTGRRPVWEDFVRLRRDLDDLVWSDRMPKWRPMWGQSNLFPLLNVNEDDESFVVAAEIPGMKTDDLEIRIDGETLAIKGERRPEEIPGDASYHRRERTTGSFQRSITLPKKVQASKVSATYKNGVLKVRLSKEKEEGPRQIAVEPR